MSATISLQTDNDNEQKKPMVSSVFVVIPAYNEGQVLRATLEPLIQANYSIVVVDDGSKDDTWATLQTLPVYALRHRINLGQGAALQTGVAFALRQGADMIIHFDADGQHRIEDIEGLLAPLRRREVDVVLGSRFLRKGDGKTVPGAKRFLLRGAIMVNGLMTGLWLKDAHNGFRALTREAAQRIVLQEKGFSHASEILSQIRKHKLRYLEIPTRIHYSRYSKAKGQSAWNALNIIFDLFMRGIFK